MGRLHDGKVDLALCATLQEANWNRSSSCWDMSRFKQPSDTLAASSGFDRRSMIASESNQIPESRGSGRVADHPVVTGDAWSRLEVIIADWCCSKNSWANK
jgi:hypothetical protein